jgi:hypothetical protein
MTHLEYIKKKDSIAVSDAPIEVREQAMKDLDTKYFKNPTEEARKQILESSADTSDIGSVYE